nr:hypothetical protein [Tanacetum cinerariifolium]
MSETIPPIPPPPGTNFSNVGSPNRYNNEEGLINAIYESEIQRFTIYASSSKALISNNQFQDNDSDVEEDLKSSSKFIADLNTKYHERTLLENQKRKVQGTEEEIVVLTKKIDAMSKGKSEKGLVAESFNWDEECVSSEDEGTTKVKVFMAIAKEEPPVGKADARSS